MNWTYVFKILGLGFIGLGFFLAFFAYNLIKKQPNPPYILIICFMAFSIILCVFYLSSQMLDQNKLNKEIDSYRSYIIATITGQIDKPKNGQSLQKTFECSGHINNYKEGSGLHIWLAVEVDNLMWPKERQLEVKPDGKWSAQVYQDSPPTTKTDFSLSLIAVTDDANNHIKDWLERGKKEGNYKGMRMEGLFRLYRTENLHLNI
jgi:hypothetical protein